MINVNSKIEDIIVALRAKLRVPIGRHLYGILGDYTALNRFEKEIEGTTIADGEPFPSVESVNKGIRGVQNLSGFLILFYYGSL